MRIGETVVGGLDRRRVVQLLMGGIGAGVAGTAVLGRDPAAAQALAPAYLNQTQTFTAPQTFSQPTVLAQITVTAPSATAVAMTAKLATGQSADAFQVLKADGSVVASVNASGDITASSVVVRGFPWHGQFRPPLAFESDRTVGWMPHPAGIGAFSYVKSGRECIRLSDDGAVTQMQTFGTNRFMLISNSAIVFYSASGHIEYEGPAGAELTIMGYQVASAIGKTVLFVTEPAHPAIPLAVQGSGSVNIQEWRGLSGRLAVDQFSRLKFPVSSQSDFASAGTAELPAKPVGFFSMTDASGMERKVPYYAS